MDIRELEVFLAVAEHLHFGRASQFCHLSPSALTRMVQRLEEQLGQPLFLRDNRSVQLSPSGERFRGYARRAVQEFREMRDALAGIRHLSGVLSIYASITAVYSVLPDLLEVCRTTYPEIQIELRTGVAEQAVAQVEAGEIDIAVAALPDQHSTTIAFLPLMTTPLVFIAGKQSPVAAENRAGGELDLRRVPLVLPQTGLSRRRLEKWLKRKGIVPRIGAEVSGNEAIIPMVHLGCGVGIVPQLVLERSPFHDQVVVLGGAPPLEPYVVGFCSSRRNLHKPVVRAFWDLAQQSAT